MIINSVSGPICTEQLGITLMHEHIVCYSHSMYAAFGEKWFAKEKLIEIAAAQLRMARQKYHIDTIVDGTPVNLGRNIRLLSEVARKSGVNIIASSGMYYTEEPFLTGKSPELLAEFFVDECANGIEGTNILPGILKCATDWPGITPINKMLLETMAIVQHETGLPLFAHSFPKMRVGLEQLNLFEKNNVDISRVIIGHSGDSFDIVYLEELLKRGCYIGMDRFRHSMGEENISCRMDTICILAEHGWMDKMFLSHDYTSYIDFRNNRWEDTAKSDYLNLESDFTYIHREIIPELKKRGFREQDIDKLMIDNPRHFFEGKAGTM